MEPANKCNLNTHSIARMGLAVILALVLFVGMCSALSQSAQANPQAALPGAPDNTPPNKPAPVTRTRALPADWFARFLRQTSGTEASSAADMLVVLSADTGTADPRGAYIGDKITYTIALTGQSQITLTDLLLVDLLPRNTLDGETIGCDPACELGFEETQVPEPSGGTIIVRVARQVSWTLPSLVNGEGVTRTFWGKLIGQPEGALFTNRAFVSYVRAGDYKTAASEPLDLIAHLQIRSGGGISPEPTWFSQDMGGTISQDWGDFDRDGQLDLALGSSLGASIYRNANERLTLIWSSPLDDQGNYRLAYGVRWVEVLPNAQHQPDLVVVGDSTDHSATGAGINYIYSYNSTQRTFVQSGVFTSEYQLVRIVAGDFDGDGALDLVGSTNAVNVPCPVVLYRNDGTGHFTGTLNSAVTSTLTSTLGIRQDFECLSRNATAALGAADYDNDGDPDLAVGAFPNAVKILINNTNGSPITNANPLPTSALAEANLEYVPYDLVWGDYDQDGQLELAGAFPLQRQVRLYTHSTLTMMVPFSQVIHTSPFMTPLSVDWGDFNGDGRPDLLVGDSPPAVYQYQPVSQTFTLVGSMALPASNGQAWSVRGVSANERHSLDIAMSNRDGPSQLFSGFTPRLTPALVPVGANAGRASSAALGDVDGDGRVDLVLGAAPAPNLSSLAYINHNGTFTTTSSVEFLSTGFGPHQVALGDVNGDGKLDVAIGTPVALQIYTDMGDITRLWNVKTDDSIHSLAWSDANDDGQLDLAVGYAGGWIELYLNQGAQLAQTPAFSFTVNGDARSLAWGDFDNDYYLDLAVGVDGGPAQVYRNKGDGTFGLAWTSPLTLVTIGNANRAVSWADYNRDGNLDLAVGSYDGGVQVWNNVITDSGHTLGATPVWTATLAQVMSLAWGDWDNDGYADLAVGRDSQPVVVYANLKSTVGSPQLVDLWHSDKNYVAASVAWGDVDGDGDLDLALGRRDGPSGYFENSLIAPAHLPKAARSGQPLPNNPPSVYIPRPGRTSDGYLYSAPEVLALPAEPLTLSQIITIPYVVYDPESDPIAATTFEYSLDGGSTWRTAKAASSSPAPLTQTSKGGLVGLFVWDAGYDRAVSENARFRVRVVSGDVTGPVQRASGSAISPPFRVRALECFWPSGISILAPANPPPFQEVIFQAQVALGSGQLSATWDFGDGTIGAGWEVTHTFNNKGFFTVTLRVDGPVCPIARPGMGRLVLKVGDGIPYQRIYMPIVSRDYSGTLTTTLTSLVFPEATSARAAATGSALAAVPPAPGTAATSVPVLPAWIQERLAQQATRVDAPPARAPRVDALPDHAVSAAATASRLPLRIAGGGVNSRPSVNADGSNIAFWSTGNYVANNADGNIEIFMAQRQAGNNIDYTQISSSTGSILAGFNLAPSIDKAGERIAFFSDRDLAGQNPDRNLEVFIAARPNVTLPITVAQVTRTPKGVNILPALSGNGRFIAFASDALTVTGQPMPKGGQTEIFRAEIDTDGALTPTWYISYTRVTTITQEPGVSDQPTINGDGQCIAFLSNQDLQPARGNADSNREIFLAQVGLDGAITYTQITSSTGGLNEQPSITADGRRIAFISNRDLDPGKNPSGSREVFYADVSPGLGPGATVTITQIVISTLGDKDQPKISADGTRVAFITANDNKLHVFDLIDGKEAQGNPGNTNAYPSLSPDGTRVAFVANWNVYLANYPLADLKLTKTGVPTDSIARGKVLTYTLVVSNAGPSVADAVILTDLLPVAVQLRSFDVPDYTDTGSGFQRFGHQHYGTTVDGVGLTLNTSVNTFELPGAATPAPQAWMNMAGNVLLLHLNEGDSTVFDDVSSSNIDGSCVLGNCPAPATGKFFNAARFNGANSLISVPDLPALDLTSFTVGAWVWPEQVKGDWQPLIVKETSSGALRNYGLFIKPNSTSVHFSFESGYRSWYWSWDCTSWPTWHSYDSNDSLTLNQWNHVMMTYDRYYLRLYINGDLDRSEYVPWYYYPMCLNNEPVKLGRELSAYQPFVGRMDEAAIFNRALSAQEVANIYQRQNPPRAGFFDSRIFTQTASLVGWNSVTWRPEVLVGRALPDNGGADTGFPTLSGTVAMTDNVLLLHLDEPAGFTNFADTSGYANNGQCFGMLCPAAGISGRFGKALRFDGSDDYVEILSNPSLNLSGGNFSEEVWVYPTSDYTYGSIVGLRPDNFYQSYPSILVSGRRIYGRFGDGASYRQFESVDLVLTPNAWNHVVATFDKTDYRLYVNGVSRAIDQYGWPSPYSVTIPYSTTQVRLGAIGNYYSPFTGLIDEVAIYARTLSPSEIQARYYRGTQRIQFQARSCAQNNCNVESFVGPDGTRSTYYAFSDSDSTPTAFGLDLPDKRFFQYRVFMDTFAPTAPRLISVTVSPWANCAGGDMVICTIGTQIAPLAPFRSVTVTLPVTVTPQTFTTTLANGQYAIVNRAGVSSAASSDHTPADNYREWTTPLEPLAIMQINISGPTGGLQNVAYSFVADVGIATPPVTYTWQATEQSGVPPHAGQLTDTATFTWTALGRKTITVTAQNKVNSLASTFQISIALPITAITVTNDSPTDLGDTTGLTATADGTDVTYSWNLGDGSTASGSAITHQYLSQGIYTAVVTASNPLGSISATTVVTVNTPPVLSINKSGPTTATPGSTIEYTLYITNSGASKARNVVITDAIPVGANYVGGGVRVGNVVSWTVAQIARYSSLSFTFQVTATQTITNSSYRVSATGGYSALGANVVRTVIAPVLSITKSGPANATSGVPFTYTLTFTNTGGLATGLIITDTLPAGANYVSGSASDGGTFGGNTVQWNMSSLSYNQTLTRTFAITATQTVTNTLYTIQAADGSFANGTAPVVTNIP